jgi:hypothetical protein
VCTKLQSGRVWRVVQQVAKNGEFTVLAVGANSDVPFNASLIA